MKSNVVLTTGLEQHQSEVLHCSPFIVQTAYLLDSFTTQELLLRWMGILIEKIKLRLKRDYNFQLNFSQANGKLHRETEWLTRLQSFSPFIPTPASQIQMWLQIKDWLTTDPVSEILVNIW